MTIDAMGCQAAIAEAILDREADYVLAVKDNPSMLCKGIADSIRERMETTSRPLR